MSAEVPLKPSGYSLSSWNYGSFHHCNPTFLPNEYIRRERITDSEQPKRPQSLNKFGKRKLAEEEKIGKFMNLTNTNTIVSNEQIRLMNDYYIIKYGKPYLRSHSANKRTHKQSNDINEEGELEEKLNQSNNQEEKSMNSSSSKSKR